MPVFGTWEPQRFQYKNSWDLLPYLAKFCWADEWSHYHSKIPEAPQTACRLSAKVRMHKAQQKESANLKMGESLWHTSKHTLMGISPALASPTIGTENVWKLGSVQVNSEKADGKNLCNTGAPEPRDTDEDCPQVIFRKIAISRC